MTTISPFSLSLPYRTENRRFSTLSCTKTGSTQPKLSAACFVVQSCLADADFVVSSNYCLIGTRLKARDFFRHEILSRRSWRSISRRTPSTSGTVRAKAHTSDNDWASCTPSSPSTWGRISTAGMKNSPCRAAASSDACHTLLMVWVSMLEMAMTPHRGNTAH